MSYGAIRPGLRRRIPFDISEFVDEGGTFVRDSEGLHSFLHGEEVVEFELTPLGESTALLASSGTAAVAGGTTGILAPSTAAVGTGIGAGLVTIGAGLAIGLSGGATLPGHKYIGPGNEEDAGEPVDEDDRIASVHDTAYGVAATQEEVRAADTHAIDEFDKDFQETGNIHSAIGRTGLQIKKAVEDRVGVLYPSNLPVSTTPSGMGVRDANFPPNKNNYADMSMSKKRYTWAQYNSARFRKRLPLVWPDFMPRGSEGVTNKPPNWRDIPAGYPHIRASAFQINPKPHNVQVERPPRGNIVNMLNNQRQNNLPSSEIHRLAGIDNSGNPVPSTSTGVTEAPTRKRNRPEDIEALPGFASASKRPNIISGGATNVTMSGGTRDAVMRREMATPMEESPGPAAASSGGGGSGHTAKADGGFDSSQGPESLISRGGYSHSGGHKTFTKVHHLKSFAIPFVNLGLINAKYTTTPLAEIPWDKMFLYMSEDEFNLIPDGSHVKNCKISVQNLVSSTQFPTGATVATTATFNHPKIGILGFDLEKSSRGGQTLDYTMSNMKEMIPSSVASPDYTDFILKQYGTDQSSASWDGDALPGTMFPIPYNLYKYFSVYQPNSALAIAQGYDSTNSFGYENFNACITQFNLNDRTWDTIFEREYSFTSAPIGTPFKAVEVRDVEINQSVGNNFRVNTLRNVSNYGPAGDATISESFSASTASQVPLVTYLGRIEQGANLSKGDAAMKPARQPTVHFGMKAIPKLSSLGNETRASEFVHAEVMFVVTATMTIETNSFPNRFIKPKANTVSIENVYAGTGRRAVAPDNNEAVTFGLPTSAVF